jgi:hypothetical protein
VIGRSILVVVWLLTGVVVSATGLELLLQARIYWHARNDATPNSHRLERAYAPFGILHLHPQYFFFFPRDPAARVAMSNETCSIDADGFRGPGPARAGGRPLAFLLGGSAAFGYMASSDETTITGYLNRLQDTYFFVNAAVPSWNSTQEMFRLAFQILDYRPALIVAYDGANDAQLLDAFGRTASDYSAGMPEEFEALDALVDDGGSLSVKRAIVSLAGHLLPELHQRIRDALDDRDARRAGPVSDASLRTGVARYLANLTRMSELATAEGARFVAVFQPVAQLHRHLGSGPAFEPVPVVERFHREVVAQLPRHVEFHDLGDVFDQHYAAIPVMNPDITDKTIFVDQVHLYDPGNEIVARHIAGLIR